MTPLLAQRSRSDRSFERLYRRHAGDVYRYALAVMRNPADAEDVTQTTFLNAYRAFTGGEQPRVPKNWLIAIAHNVCRQRFRQAARRPSEVELNEEIAEALVREEPVSVEDIQRALGQLAFNQRAALVMRELEGRSYAEIASILELSPSAVETLIFRARRALREQLEGSLTCSQAELALSKQADGELSRGDKGQLRAHLRECKSCSTIARRLRAQRTAWRALGAIPLPGSLSGLFGGSGTAVATGLGTAGGGALALKASVAVGVFAIAGGSALEGKHLLSPNASPARPAVGKLRPVVAEPVAVGSARPARSRVPAAVRPRGELSRTIHALQRARRVEGSTAARAAFGGKTARRPRVGSRAPDPRPGAAPPSPAPPPDVTPSDAGGPKAVPPRGPEPKPKPPSAAKKPTSPPGQAKQDPSSAPSGKEATPGQAGNEESPGQTKKDAAPPAPDPSTSPSPPASPDPPPGNSNDNGTGNGGGGGNGNGGANK